MHAIILALDSEQLYHNSLPSARRSPSYAVIIWHWAKNLL